LFLFVHDLVRLDGDALALGAKLPGSGMIPAGHALRASLALKLWSIERKSHVMALVADEGLALFCGLNAMPKKSFLSEYSSRITPQKVSRLLGLWHGQLTGETLLVGESLNLDFHSVPYFGEHPQVESHYLSKRSRRSPASSPSWPRTPTARYFVIRTPTSARARRPRRCFASSPSGSVSTAACRNTSSSTPSSRPTMASIGSMRPESPSSPCGDARQAPSPRSTTYRHRLGAPSPLRYPAASIAPRASTNRRLVRTNAPSASSSSPISATTSPPSCSPTTPSPPLRRSSPAMPSACSSRTRYPTLCASSTSMRS